MDMNELKSTDNWFEFGVNLEQKPIILPIPC